jgi:hypothetical protein
MSFPPATEMFQFAGFASPPYEFRRRYPRGWVAPFGDPGINDRSHLPRAFRSVPRPSSPLSAKASTRCPYLRLSATPNGKNHKRPPRCTATRPAGLRPRQSGGFIKPHREPLRFARDPCQDAANAPSPGGTSRLRRFRRHFARDTHAASRPRAFPLRSHNSLLHDCQSARAAAPDRDTARDYRGDKSGSSRRASRKQRSELRCQKAAQLLPMPPATADAGGPDIRPLIAGF